MVPIKDEQAPEVMIGQQSYKNVRKLSPEILTDLDLSREKRLEQLLQGIIDQADESDKEKVGFLRGGRGVGIFGIRPGLPRGSTKS